MMTSMLMTLALGTLPAFVFAERHAPATAKAEPGPREPSAVRLSIDHSKLLGPEPAHIAERTAGYIREDGAKNLREVHGVQVVDDPEAPEILVTLSWKVHDESIYGVVVETRRPGEAARLVDSFPCECIDSGLTAEIVERLPKALEQLAEAVEAPEPVPEPTPAVEPSSPSSAVAEGGTDQPVRKAAALGPLGYVGIAVTAGGLGMAGFGIAELVKGQVREPSANDEQRGQELDHRPAGRAWLGAGLGVAVAGATMLAIDLTVLKRRRQQRISWVPLGSPTQIGLSVNGRF